MRSRLKRTGKPRTQQSHSDGAGFRAVLRKIDSILWLTEWGVREPKQYYFAICCGWTPASISYTIRVRNFYFLFFVSQRETVIITTRRKYLCFSCVMICCAACTRNDVFVGPKINDDDLVANRILKVIMFHKAYYTTRLSATMRIISVQLWLIRLGAWRRSI